MRNFLEGREAGKAYYDSHSERVRPFLDHCINPRLCRKFEIDNSGIPQNEPQPATKMFAYLLKECGG